MFTGITENIGQVTKVTRKPNLATIAINAGAMASGVKRGESLSVDGVCLSVTRKSRNILAFDVMKETLDRTTLGTLSAKDKVNLERALKVRDRLNGHFVTGHIDGIGRIKNIIRDANYCEFKIQAPNPLMRFIAPKGSICIDGISLTVGRVGKNYFSFYLIPYTQKGTTLGHKRIGQSVNIETDILAKYILRWT